MNWTALIPILGGLYGYLMATGKLPKSPKDPDKMDEWRRKFGPMLKVICPVIMVFGILQLVGIIPV